MVGVLLGSLGDPIDRPAASCHLFIIDTTMKLMLLPASADAQEPTMTATPAFREMTPAEIHDALQRHQILLIDVREPQEYVTERIQGALLFPTSTFDPTALPTGGDRPVVLHCGTSKRSGMALAQCLEAGVAVTAHMKGGLLAWKEAGLPIVTLDPATGAVVAQR
jgi:rhodanese-related sulfurtransferase